MVIGGTSAPHSGQWASEAARVPVRLQRQFGQRELNPSLKRQVKAPISAARVSRSGGSAGDMRFGPGVAFSGLVYSFVNGGI